MKNLSKYKAAMSRKKVQAAFPLDAILKPAPMTNDEIDQMGANAPMMGDAVSRSAAHAVEAVAAAPSPVGVPQRSVDAVIVHVRSDRNSSVRFCDGAAWEPPPPGVNLKHCEACQKAIRPKERPKDSPAMRDERMRHGRLPGGSFFTTHPFDDRTNTWKVELYVPSPPNKGQLQIDGVDYWQFTTSHDGVHSAMERLWKDWLAWKAEQAATKEAAK